MALLLVVSILLQAVFSLVYASCNPIVGGAPVISRGSPSVSFDKSHDSTEQCSCYVTSGPSSGYFQNYEFFDFRDLTSDLDNPDDISSVLTSSSFYELFTPQGWSTKSSTAAPIPMDHSIDNVFVSVRGEGSHPNTTLDLHTSRLANSQSTAELELTRKNLFHASIRIRARIEPGYAPGAVAGFFTYANVYPPGSSQTDPESDIEILTKDPRDTIRYTNHPSFLNVSFKSGEETVFAMEPIPEASTITKLPHGKTWDTFLTHRLDWFPGVSRFWVDDFLVADTTHAVPRVPMGVIMNLWSNGGNFSGKMAAGDSTILSIEYIEMAFNTSGPYTGPDLTSQEQRRDVDSTLTGSTSTVLKRSSSGEPCKVVCQIDGVREVGRPERVGDGKGEAGHGVPKKTPTLFAISLAPLLIALLLLL